MAAILSIMRDDQSIFDKKSQTTLKRKILINNYNQANFNSTQKIAI